MTSPIIDGNLMIVSLAVSTWGRDANRAQRLIAMDKKTGDIVWISSPGRAALRYGVCGDVDRDPSMAKDY